jgi:hypothetical protein
MPETQEQFPASVRAGVSNGHRRIFLSGRCMSGGMDPASIGRFALRTAAVGGAHWVSVYRCPPRFVAASRSSSHAAGRMKSGTSLWGIRQRSSPMKWIHIIAGLVSIVAGFIALYSAKGRARHRQSGVVFAYAMLVMTGTAVVMATFFSPNRVNVVAGTLTFCLVSTSWLTVRRTVEQSRVLIAGFMAVFLATSVYAFSLGAEAVHSAGAVDKIPAPPIFLFAIVGMLAAVGDARVLWAGHIEGVQRIARHLWRMTFAMWVATTSLFLGQAKMFPAPLRHLSLLAIPVLLVTFTLFYWLWRVLLRRRAPISASRTRAERATANA